MNNNIIQVLSKCQNSFNENVYFDLDGKGLRNNNGQYINNQLLGAIRHWHQLDTAEHIYAVFYDYSYEEAVFDEPDVVSNIGDSLSQGNSFFSAIGGALLNSALHEREQLSDERHYHFTSCFLNDGISIADIEETNNPDKKPDDYVGILWNTIQQCENLEYIDVQAEDRKTNAYYAGAMAYGIYNHLDTVRFYRKDGSYLNVHCACFAHFSIADLINEIIQTCDFSGENTNQVNNLSSDNETQYLEEVKFMLEDDSVIDEKERVMLDRLRQKLNISEEKAKELENKLIATIQNISEEEKKYLEEVKFMLEDDGVIDDKEKAMLERIRLRLGISEQRASDLKQKIAIFNGLTDEENEYLAEIKHLAGDGKISDKDRRILARLANMLGISEDRARELENKI